MGQGFKLNGKPSMVVGWKACWNVTMGGKKIWNSELLAFWKKDKTFFLLLNTPRVKQNTLLKIQSEKDFFKYTRSLTECLKKKKIRSKACGNVTVGGKWNPVCCMNHLWSYQGKTKLIKLKSRAHYFFTRQMNRVKCESAWSSVFRIMSIWPSCVICNVQGHVHLAVLCNLQCLESCPSGRFV